MISGAALCIHRRSHAPTSDGHGPAAPGGEAALRGLDARAKALATDWVARVGRFFRFPSRGYSRALRTPVHLRIHQGDVRRLDLTRLSGLLLVCTVSCASVELVPTQAGAVAVGAGVELRAHTEARPWSVPDAFTPVRISVRNTGAEPVFVGVEDILLASTTVELSAVPPASITPRRRVASLGMDPGSPFVALQGTAGGFRGQRGRTESVLLQPGPGAHYESTFDARDPARDEVSSRAFPGGLIKSGQTRAGFVYFREVPSDASQLTLRVFVRTTRDAPRGSVMEIVYSVRS